MVSCFIFEATMVNGAKHYMFTINNPDAVEGGGVRVGTLLPAEWPADDVQFVVWQLEVGEEGGTLHYQGYLQLTRRRTIVQLKRWAGLEGANFQVARSPVDAKDYCEKEETRVDGPWYYPSAEAFVDPKETQKRSVRTDLIAVKKRFMDGDRLEDIVRDDDGFVTFVKFPRGLQTARRLLVPPRTEVTVGLVLWGSSGSGKSTTARALAACLGKRVYHVPQEKGSGIYFDGYEAGDVVIIDEMDGTRFTPKFLNQLLDEAPFSVPVHGDSVVFNSKYIIFTSNKHPSQWWPRFRVGRSTSRRMAILPVFTRSPRSAWKSVCDVAGVGCVLCRGGTCAMHCTVEQRRAREEKEAIELAARKEAEYHAFLDESNRRLDELLAEQRRNRQNENPAPDLEHLRTITRQFETDLMMMDLNFNNLFDE